jgi:hypothetical protein
LDHLEKRNLEGCTIDECSHLISPTFHPLWNLKSSFHQASNLFPNILSIVQLSWIAFGSFCNVFIHYATFPKWAFFF